MTTQERVDYEPGEIKATPPGVAQIPLDGLRADLEKLHSEIPTEMRYGESARRVTRAEAIVLAEFVLKLANPLLFEEGNTIKLRYLKDHIRSAATRFSEYDQDGVNTKIKELSSSAKNRVPNAIVAFRQIQRQDGLPIALSDPAVSTLAEATVWHVGLNHNPILKNQVN